MAIIKSLAVGKAKGSAGNLTYTTMGGDTIMKGKVAFPANPKTVGQMSRRVRWANLVNIWQTFTQRDHPSFEARPPRVSDFNAFMGANIGGAPVYLTSSEAKQNGSVIAAYQVTEGSLPSIDIGTGTGGVRVSDISLGALVIDADTTLKEFSEAVIDNNDNYIEGDQITCFIALQTQNVVTGIPYVQMKSSKVTLNTRDEDTLLSDLVAADGFTTVDGKLGASAVINGGIVWIHSRVEQGNVLVSTQSFAVTNSLISSYNTTAAKTAAIQSYGGQLTRAYLRPYDPMLPGTV